MKRKSPPVAHANNLADGGRMPAERSAIRSSAMPGLEDRGKLSLAAFVPMVLAQLMSAASLSRTP